MPATYTTPTSLAFRISACQRRPEPKMDVQQLRKQSRADGPACVLGIGTATPDHTVDQSTYADYYFRLTNAEHMTELKHKFSRMCEKSQIQKRYMHLTPRMLAESPNIAKYMAPSLDARQDIVIAEVPRLGGDAAKRALADWRGAGKGAITHMVFCTTSGVDMPGADYRLTKLLGLSAHIKRIMLYQQGCFAGGTVLRVAKDLAENNRGARVLVVCAEITAMTFRGPTETHLDSMVGQALFGDGAAAVVVGADPTESERAWFELIWTAQTILPDSEGAIDGHLREEGLTFHLMRDVPALISRNIGRCVRDALSPLGICDWNEVFWVAHPGGPAILDEIEATLRLRTEKLRASRRVLREFGNMSSACVLFILDEIRHWSVQNGCETAGEGFDLGILFGFGPGLTVETVVLRGVPLPREPVCSGDSR